MMKNNRIEVDTVFGKLFAEIGGDPEYPGIVICVERELRDGIYDYQLALAECTPNEPEEGLHALRLMVWGNDESDDYTEAYTFLEETKPEPPEVIWGKYLQYLREWTGSHSEAGFIGMTPACYEEWLVGEYAQEVEEYRK